MKKWFHQLGSLQRERKLLCKVSAFALKGRKPKEMTAKCSTLFAERDSVTVKCLSAIRWESKFDSSVTPSLRGKKITSNCQSTLLWKRTFDSRVSVCSSLKENVSQVSVKESSTAECQLTLQWNRKFGSKVSIDLLLEEKNWQQSVIPSPKGSDSKVSSLHWKSLTAKCHPFTERVWQQSVDPALLEKNWQSVSQPFTERAVNPSLKENDSKVSPHVWQFGNRVWTLYEVDREEYWQQLNWLFPDIVERNCDSKVGQSFTE